MFLFPMQQGYDPNNPAHIHTQFVKMQHDSKVSRGYFRFALPMCPVWFHWRYYLKSGYENSRSEFTYSWNFVPHSLPQKTDPTDWLDMGPMERRGYITGGPSPKPNPTGPDWADAFPTQGVAFFDRSSCDVPICLIHPKN